MDLAPSVLTKQRGTFLSGIYGNKSFTSMTWKTCFVKSIKQEIKKVLIMMKIYRGGKKAEYGVLVKK